MVTQMFRPFGVKNYHHSLDAVKESAQAPLPFQRLNRLSVCGPANDPGTAR